MLRKSVISLLLALTGCGAVYHAPSVEEVAGDMNVTIVNVTSETIAQANRSNYFPRQIPAVFSQNAGTGRAGEPSRELPEGVALTESRPGLAETRLPPVELATPYEIGVGDVLVLATVQGATSVEELSGLLASQNRRQGYTVQDDGAIAIPDVGRVQMAGLNLEEAEAAVFQALVESQLDPTFSIEVAEFNSKRVTIGGAVNLATVVPITLSPLRLEEALAAAGGVAVTDPEFTTIRLYRDGTLYQIPLASLPGSNVTLAAGDSIFVDTDYELDRAQAYFQEQITLLQTEQTIRARDLSELQTEINLRRAALNEARSNFRNQIAFDAVERDYVYLTGEVTRQGRYPLPFGSQATLADALFSDARGIVSSSGNPKALYLLRAAPDGDITAYNLDVSNTGNMVLATKFQLRPNDIIFVGQQPVTKWNRVVQQIVPSLIITGVNALR